MRSTESRMQTIASKEVSSSSSDHLKSERQKKEQDEALQRIAHIYLCENNGILQQWVEHAFRPMFESLIRKVYKEKERARITEARTHLLSIKYFRRWKSIAWKKSLVRAGRQRRELFAQSMRESARSSRTTSRATSTSPVSSHTNDIWSVAAERLMPPPPRSKPKHANGNIPQTDRQLSPQMQMKVSKLTLQDPSMANRISQARRTKAHHQRSQTLGSVLGVPDNQQNDQSTMSSNSRSSKQSSNPFLSESTMKAARRLLANGKTDTTRTDYFALKARGIDPDTPMVPRTAKKRRISDNNDSVPGASKSPRLTPSADAIQQRRIPSIESVAPSASSTSTPQRTLRPDDEFDRLIAQAREVGQKMADEEQWLREERERGEQFLASRQRKPETEKERKLRELKERPWTPSRSEIRLRKDDKGLLPKGFWEKRDRERARERGELVSGEDEEMEAEAPPPKKGTAMGFAALANNAVSSMKAPAGNSLFASAKGSSADDAFELSD
jgi:hypothetical protein